MLTITRRNEEAGDAPVSTSVTLTAEQRDKGRQRLQADNGEELQLFLERGQPLRVGELLRADCGRWVRIEGAEEEVIEARAADWPGFARACYHLGNRHVRLQLGECWLRMEPDHVLEELLHLLGLEVTRTRAVFEPESGAYSHGHHHH